MSTNSQLKRCISKTSLYSCLRVLVNTDAGWFVCILFSFNDKRDSNLKQNEYPLNYNIFSTTDRGKYLYIQ